MLQFEEDIEDMVQQAITVLGPMGRIDTDHKEDPECRDVLVRVGNFGEVWYGDTTARALQELSNITKYEIMAYGRQRDHAQLWNAVMTVYPSD